jgi:hypothetical protein
MVYVGTAGPRVHRRLHSGSWPRHAEARHSGRFGTWQPTAVGGKWRGRCNAAEERLTEAWMMARRWHNGGGASAQDGDGMMRTKRRRVGGVGIFAGAEASNATGC